jgi:hypothetical protein
MKVDDIVTLHETMRKTAKMSVRYATYYNLAGPNVGMAEARINDKAIFFVKMDEDHYRSIVSPKTDHRQFEALRTLKRLEERMEPGD